jgi:hypothetical protein
MLGRSAGSRGVVAELPLAQGLYTSPEERADYRDLKFSEPEDSAIVLGSP